MSRTFFGSFLGMTGVDNMVEDDLEYAKTGLMYTEEGIAGFGTIIGMVELVLVAVVFYGIWLRWDWLKYLVNKFIFGTVDESKIHIE